MRIVCLVGDVQGIYSIGGRWRAQNPMQILLIFQSGDEIYTIQN